MRLKKIMDPPQKKPFRIFYPSIYSRKKTVLMFATKLVIPAWVSHSFWP